MLSGLLLFPKISHSNLKISSLVRVPNLNSIISGTKIGRPPLLIYCNTYSLVTPSIHPIQLSTSAHPYYICAGRCCAVCRLTMKLIMLTPNTRHLTSGRIRTLEMTSLPMMLSQAAQRTGDTEAWR